MAQALQRTSLGLGLRVPVYDQLQAPQSGIDYCEIITENFLAGAGRGSEVLRAVAQHYPIVLHGVSLNLLGSEPPELAYLDQVAELAEKLDAPFITDHLCWTGAHGHNHHDLLPTPYVDELVELAIERARFVQEHLGRPFGLENLSSYVSFARSTMSEWEFYRQVVEGARCHYLLDINNIYVSSVNHGFDALSYVEAIDFERVLQVHVAGHSVEADGTLVDTHDHPVPLAVWQLYQHAWQHGGPFPTLLEWDAKIPGFAILQKHLAEARNWQSPELSPHHPTMTAGKS